MFLFLLILFPCFLVYYCMRSKDSSIKLVTFFGFLLGIIVCTCIFLFSFKHRISSFDFASNFAYYALVEYVLPLILVYVFYFLVCKDNLEFRIKSFFPFVGGFFSIYMPFSILAGTSVSFSFFELFIKPLLFLAMVIFSAYFVLVVAKKFLDKKIVKAVLCIIILALLLFVPPFINTLWLLKIWMPFVFGASVFYVLCALILFLISVKSEDSIFI